MKTSGQFQKQSALPSQPIPLTQNLFQSRPFRDPKATATAQPAEAIDNTIRMKGYLDSNGRPAWWSTVSFGPQPVAGVQTKLTVGAPNDQYEQEADRVADQVMSMPDSATQQPIQREAMPDDDELQTKPLSASITPLVQREEIAATEEEEETLQMMSVQREEMLEEEDAPQTKPALQSATDGSLQAGSSIKSRLNNSQGGGSPLPNDVRSFMEPRFGADFSQVRVHTGSEAVQMNRDLNAQAFTHKQDVYFGAGKAPAKDALTAHELTHVVQQKGEVQTKLNQEPTVQRECSTCEEERSVQRKSSEILASSEVGIQRWFGDDEKKEPESSSGEGILDWAKGKVGGAVNSLAETGGAAIDWAKQKGSAAVETVTQVGSEAVDWAKQQGNAAAETATKTGNEVADLATNIGGKAVKEVSDLAEGSAPDLKVSGLNGFVPPLGSIPPSLLACLEKASLSKAWDIAKAYWDSGWNGLVYNEDTIEIVCNCLPDKNAIEIARHTMFGKGELASKHLDHYISGSGADYYEDLHTFLVKDSYARQKLIEGILANGVQGKQDIQQRDYLIQEYRNSFGAMVLNFSVDDSSQARESNRVNAGTAIVHVEMSDLYRWHPQEPRITQCLHKIFESMKNKGAKDFWMVGSTNIALELPSELIPQ